MKATVIYGAGDVRIENVPDARIIESTDALVIVTRGMYDRKAIKAIIAF